VEPRLESNVDEALWLLATLADAGVDYDDVVDRLEHEGIQKFADSFSELLAQLEAKRRSPALR
jgi:transaldolase